jgi:hypothetical protein
MSIGIGVLPTKAFAEQLGVTLTWTNCAEKQIQILCVDALSIVIVMYSAAHRVRIIAIIRRRYEVITHS